MQSEAGASCVAGVHGEAAAVVLSDGLAQPEAEAHAISFGAVKKFKDLRPLRGGDAESIVRHGEFQCVLLLLERD